MIDAIDHIEVPERPAQEAFVPSSLQFSLVGLSEDRIVTFLEAAAAHGVHLKWFGAKEPVGFTSRYDHWRYMGADARVPRADKLLQGLCDMRLPLWLTSDDCITIARVLREAMSEATSAGTSSDAAKASVSGTAVADSTEPMVETSETGDSTIVAADPPP